MRINALLSDPESLKVIDESLNVMREKTPDGLKQANAA